MASAMHDRMVELRRTFHRYPEPAWREFYTTHLLVTELERLGLNWRREGAGPSEGPTEDAGEFVVGKAAMAPGDRLAVPPADELDRWFDRARERGAREDVLEVTEGGFTGIVARVDNGDGPSIGLRVDIDGLFVEEAADDEHEPAAGGYRSEHQGLMHACGHDAHMTIGLGTLAAFLEDDIPGSLTVFFQPAEEEAGGGKPMAAGPFAEGLDYLLAVHIGLGHPTGEVVAGMVKPLAMSHIEATFRGRSAHAGQAPNEGRNAIQAVATAVQNAYGIPRHADGATRVNIGRIDAGSASNVIAETARVVGEVRGETTALMEYMKAEYWRTFESAAAMHGCEVSLEVHGESPRADSDPELVDVIYDVASETPGVTAPVRTADFGASEDATYLMQAVQDAGGLATYLIVGTDHPDGHHTSRFDIDERSLEIAVNVLSESIRRLAGDPP